MYAYVCMCGGCVVWWLCPKVPEFKLNSSNFHLIYHLPPTCPTSPPSWTSPVVKNLKKLLLWCLEFIPYLNINFTFG